MALQNNKIDANGNALVSAQLATLPQLVQGTAVSAQLHGTLRVTPDPTSIFYDSFSGNTLDLVNRWTTSGTAPVQSNGFLTFPSSTASTTSILTSQPVIPLSASHFILPALVAKLEAAVGTGVGRFWGMGSAPTTPTTTSLAQEGVGFEVDATTGALQAVTYTAGVKTVIAALTKPTDNGWHRYAMQYRNSRCYWFVDDLNVYVTTSTFLNTAIQDMQVMAVSVSGATPVNTPALSFNAMGVSDLNRQATQISDGLFPHRKVSVGKTGGLSVKGVSIPVVSATFAAAAVGTIGAVDVSEAGNCTFIVKNSVAASPFGAGGVLVFEQSDDNVSWTPLATVRQDGTAGSTATLGANAANTSQMYDAALEGVNWVRARLTTGVTTNGVTVNIQASGMPFAPIVSVYPLPAGTSTIGTVLPFRPGTVTATAPASAITSGVLLAANAARAGATIYNNSTSVLYVELGATASLTAFTVVLAALSGGIGGYYEVPFGYRGVISGIWATANGTANIRELV